ncbi:hypothetical protein K488DRAFT_83043 [Vararia minispora EC-137]|uniref:Uncharacterized protein n=1 Tax=Vararia minispora EC-137 TaxID=1314806 RepID=A0ACB8QVV5_9AGAM|nr:hypothetical protein K488DRAFT_83043 [Vararia minispora EC-137]
MPMAPPVRKDKRASGGADGQRSTTGAYEESDSNKLPRRPRNVGPVQIEDANELGGRPTGGLRAVIEPFLTTARSADAESKMDRELARARQNAEAAGPRQESSSRASRRERPESLMSQPPRYSTVFPTVPESRSGSGEDADGKTSGTGRRSRGVLSGVKGVLRRK